MSLHWTDERRPSDRPTAGDWLALVIGAVVWVVVMGLAAVLG